MEWHSETLVKSIEMTDIDNREMLYQGIVLSGGSTMFKVSERLTKEVKMCQILGWRWWIFHRQYSAWVGCWFINLSGVGILDRTAFLNDAALRNL